MRERVKDDGGRWGRLATAACAALCLSTAAGCWAPLHYSAVPARELPDSFRMPVRSRLTSLNLAHL
ncbi:MAG: hypothetical protein ACREJB_01835, partial [Planctomycetaceae bacterium]